MQRKGTQERQEGCLLLQGGNVDAARGLAYLLNANLTLSGGCPKPSPERPPCPAGTFNPGMNHFPCDSNNTCCMLLHWQSSECFPNQRGACRKIEPPSTTLCQDWGFKTVCVNVQLGVGLAKAVALANTSLAAPGQVRQLPSNLTGAMVADAAVAGAMLAAKSCGPPNSLSSGR